MYKISRLVRISLLINALIKRVLLFSEESYFLKAIEHFFPVFAYPDINTRGVGRILPTPLVFISGYANTENVFYCLNDKTYVTIIVLENLSQASRDIPSTMTSQNLFSETGRGC